MSYFHELSDIPAVLRLPFYLHDLLEDEYGKLDMVKCTKLALKLGMKEVWGVLAWTQETAPRMELEYLVPIAEALEVDVCELLSLWIARELPETNDEKLYHASLRIVSVNDYIPYLAYKAQLNKICE